MQLQLQLQFTMQLTACYDLLALFHACEKFKVNL